MIEVRENLFLMEVDPKEYPKPNVPEGMTAHCRPSNDFPKMWVVEFRKAPAAAAPEEAASP